MTYDELMKLIPNYAVFSSTGIYGIYCYGNQRVYVGQSKEMRRRYYSHLAKLKKDIHPNSHLQHAWNKYGEGGFMPFVFENCTQEMLKQREEHYVTIIDRKSLFNMGAIGESFSMSEEAKKKIGARSKGNTNNKGKKIWLGKKHSEASKEKMRLAHLGKAVSDTTKEKLSQALKGKTKSPEHIKNAAEAQKGKMVSEETKRKISETLKAKGVKPPRR